LIKPQPNFPLHKLAPRWPGPYRVHDISATSDKVTLLDTVANKLFRVLKRQLESFDVSMVSDVAGLTKVAEADNFEFPVEGICGHALITADGVGANPVQLRNDFRRGVRARSAFQFLVKWTGYEEPTWMAYKDAKRLVQFPGYVALMPGLNMIWITVAARVAFFSKVGRCSGAVFSQSSNTAPRSQHRDISCHLVSSVGENFCFISVVSIGKNINAMLSLKSVLLNSAERAQFRFIKLISKSDTILQSAPANMSAQFRLLWIKNSESVVLN
jgi:hypothetical protein